MKPNALRLRLPMAILTVAAVVAIALFAVSCGTTLFDNDRYGKVGVPGEGTLDLKAPGTIISYERRANLPSDSSIDAPEDLRISVRSVETGEAVRIEKEGNLHSYNYNDLHGTSVARAFVPEDGEYRVAARREGGFGGGSSEAITFGPDLSVGELLKRSGLVFGGGLALALLVGLVGLGVGRARGEPGGLNPKTPPQTTGGAATASAPAPSPSPAAPSPSPTPAAGTSGDPATQLAALDDARTRENLSDEEYEVRRKRIIEGV